MQLKLKHAFSEILLLSVFVIGIIAITGCVRQPPPSPDLIVESLTHSPATPTTADQVTLTAVVKNIGTGPAGSSILSFKVGGETNSAKFSVPALEPGDTHTVQRKEVLGVNQVYLIIITVLVDVNNDVSESNEANNEKMDSFTVTEVTP